MTNGRRDTSTDAYLEKDIDEQFMREAKMNAGQCHDRFLDTKLGSTVLMEDSRAHVGVLAALTETSHLMVLGQLMMDLHRQQQQHG